MKPKVFPTESWIRQFSRLLRFSSSLCSLFYKDIFSRPKLNEVFNPSFILKNTKLDSESQITALKASTLAKSNETLPVQTAKHRAMSLSPLWSLTSIILPLARDCSGQVVGTSLNHTRTILTH